MQEDVKVRPGEAAAMRTVQPLGTVPRDGGELVLSREPAAVAAAREVYAKRPNPIAASPESLARGADLFRIYCTPCHGATGKGDGTVTPRFIPAPDLGAAQTQGRPDGYLAHYIGYGGAIMPAYGESLSVSDRWDIVNHLRTLAQK
jgi:mono/diheme cytochrome c family protein